MTDIREILSHIILILVLFVILLLFLQSLGLTFNSATTIPVNNANDQSLASLWGPEKAYQQLIPTIDRSTDTIFIAGVILVAVISVSSQFRKYTEGKGEDKP